MNLLLLRQEDFCPDGSVILRDRRAEQLRNVLKVAPGTVVKAGLFQGETGSAEVLSVNGETVILHFSPSGMPVPKLPLNLALALPRPQTLRKTLHAAITLGVRKICFFGSFKVEKSYWSSQFLNLDFLLQEQYFALEQCTDTIPAELFFQPKFRPFSEDFLPEFAAGTRILAAHPAATLPCLAMNGEPCTLILGPEGGFNDYETAHLQECGAELVSLGSRILRTEVALPALVGRLFG